MNPRRILQQSKRSRDVAAVLIRYGFDDLADVLRSKQGRIRTERQESEGRTPSPRATRAERIRKVIEELGPTYVKLGQVLSTRPDLVPADLLAELAKLQDRVEPFPFEEVRQIVEAEFGRPLNAIFESFEPKPLASASLGQVHRARLDGQDVAVKIQRPGIRETMEADIQWMMQLAGQLELRLKSWAIHQPTRAVKEFERTMVEELDYQIEAAHQEQVFEQFKDDPTIRVPRIFRQTTTSRVLTMEYIDGIKVSDLDALRAAHIKLEEVAQRGFRFVVRQTLVHGLFHADPHPGNIFVLPDNVVCFIDYGMVGRLNQKVREDFVELLYNVVDRDPHRVTENILRLTNAEAAETSKDLEGDVMRFMDAYTGRPLRDMDLSKLLGEILSALSRHGLSVPPDLFLMLKAIIQIETAAVALAPGFDVVAEAEPYVRQVFMDRFRPRRLADETVAVGREYALLLRDFPAALRELSRIIRSGTIPVRFDRENTTEVLGTSDRIANRISLALVLGACLVGSAIMAAARIQPTWNGISVLGLGGFVAALTMSAWLIVSILRRGKL